MPYKDKEKGRECQKRYMLEHRDELREYKKQYLLAHREEKRISDKRFRGKLKFLVLQTYSHTSYPSCARCGIDDIDVLTIDHINGGGNKHRREIGQGIILYQWLKNNDYPLGYQTLCWNCNAKKHLSLAVICPKVAVQ